MLTNKMETSTSNIITVENLSKTFGSLKAVDNVSFEIKEGEIFGFLVLNGAGKTTTINMLTTLLKPTSGKAVVCGYSIFKDANEVRRNVGVVPQEYTADEDSQESTTSFSAQTFTEWPEKIRRPTQKNC